MSKLLSVIIPTYNRKDYLYKTLSSFNNQTYKPFEVVIVDDGSDFNLNAEIYNLELNYPVYYYYIKKKGRAGARNFGINNSKGEIILFFDDHSQPHPGLLDEHVKNHTKYPRYGGFRGRIEYISEHLDEVKYVKPGFFKSLYNLIYGSSPIVNFGTHNLSIKRSILNKTGLFDEAFNLYGAEDQEFGIRIKKAGYKIGYIPRALAFNIRIEKSIEEMLKRAIESGKMAAILIKKHPEYKSRLGINLFNSFRFYNKKNMEIYRLFKEGSESYDNSQIKSFKKLKFILYYFSLLEHLGVDVC